MKKRLLIIGADGMLGSDLAQSAAEYYEVTGVDLPLVDITHPENLSDIMQKHSPALVVNCAAWTDVDGAESNPKAARAVNETGAANAALAAKTAGAAFVHISTDFVFDGAKGAPYVEDDTPNPLSVYGETKLAGENALLRVNPDALIVRTAWLYGLHGKNFVRTILLRALNGNSLMVVDDEAGSPTWTCDLAGAILALAEKNASGVVHFTNGGAASRFDQARTILEAAGLNNEIAPISAADLKLPAKRPACSELSCEKYTRLTGLIPTPWKTAQNEFIGLWLSENRPRA